MEEARQFDGNSWDDTHFVETESVEGGLRWEVLNPPYCHEYAPSSLRAFHGLMGLVRADFVDDVFIDFGSGKGRVILAAQEYPFRRIVGVELQSGLCDIARSNAHSWSGVRVCDNLEIVCSDAEEYAIPADGTIFYMYNPFRGRVLRTVIDRIEKSIIAHPRRGWLIINHLTHFKCLNPAPRKMALVGSPRYEHDCGVFEINP